jgi:hypothetical protein
MHACICRMLLLSIKSSSAAAEANGAGRGPHSSPHLTHYKVVQVFVFKETSVHCLATKLP